MNPETKQCQNCKKDFTIEPEDFNFYEKIKVPPPTFCPECRLARKLIWRNERSLYKRTCDLCKQNIFSMYKPEIKFPVYCHDCWWSDKWDPLDYGQEYDFKVPFFEQFKKLSESVPRPSLYSIGNVNSEYCNYTAHMKDGYWMFGSWFDENCGYGQSVLESKECWDCLYIKNCELCFSILDCDHCNGVLFSQKCSSCIDSAFLFDCRNCQNCLFSWNLRNKNYYIFNKPVSKEEFAKLKKEMLQSHKSLEKYFNDFRIAIKELAIHKFMTGERNYDVSGEFIYGSKNVHNSYFLNDSENEKYALRGGKEKDAMDVFGVHSGNLAYECNSTDFSSNILFASNGEGFINSNYLVDCDHLSNSFGCISVRKKEYCILNKQYSKTEYERLKEKIIIHMENLPYLDNKERMYKYGEFFPFELSPHAYNESIAQEWVPFDEKKAMKMDYSWDAMEDKSYAPTKNWKKLPETIKETDNSILSEIILCKAWDENKESAKNHKCTKAFRITQNELLMYRRFGVPLPRKCPNTRNFELSKLRNKPNFWHRTCMCDKKHNNHEGHCEVEFETSYAPDRPEIVYCERCYQQEVY